MNNALRQRAALEQRQTLAPQMRQSLRLLAMDVGALREELYREVAENPLAEDVERTLDSHTTGEVERFSEQRERADESDWPEDGYGDDEGGAADAETLERRRRFFDSRTRPETLAEHLRAQLGLLDLDEDDRALAELLVGSLDDNGRFTGSFADFVMVTGASEARARALLKAISTLDPPGCGATSLEECLLAQLDKLDAGPWREDVREIVEHHLGDLARGDLDKVCEATGMSRERLDDVMAALRTLEPFPGRAFAPVTAQEAYIEPEVHAVRDAATGRWLARVDERDTNAIRFSKRYLALLRNPGTDAETRAYLLEKKARLDALREAIEHRSETIEKIAQAIFDAQEGFFTSGLKGLKPLTMAEIADRTQVHHTTVSRTVNGKFASTPFGVVELRAFFVAGLATAQGGEVAKDVVLERLAKLVADEDKSVPLSDEHLAARLKAEGFDIARRTVAKYRMRLGIPAAADRKV